MRLKGILIEMNRLQKNAKVIALDTLGVLLIIAAALFSWVPGPGGIPLLIGGLGLLSINHAWARRWLKKAEKHGLNFTDKIFRDSKRWQMGVDIAALVILAAGIWLFTVASRSYMYAAATSLSLMGLFLLLGNRKRFKRMTGWIKALAK